MIYSAFFCGHACVCVYGGLESDGIWIIEVDARTKRVGRHCGILASLRF